MFINTIFNNLQDCCFNWLVCVKSIWRSRNYRNASKIYLWAFMILSGIIIMQINLNRINYQIAPFKH